MSSLVLDTNILVSAIWSPNGNPAKIVELVLYGEKGIYFNSDICKEYKEVLNRPKLKIALLPVPNLLNIFYITPQ